MTHWAPRKPDRRKGWRAPGDQREPYEYGGDVNTELPIEAINELERVYEDQARDLLERSLPYVQHRHAEYAEGDPPLAYEIRRFLAARDTRTQGDIAIAAALNETGHLSLTALVTTYKGLERAEEKWRGYERDYILPCFQWAKEDGIDLQKLVIGGAGKNCVRHYVEALRQQRDGKLPGPTGRHSGPNAIPERPTDFTADQIGWLIGPCTHAGQEMISVAAAEGKVTRGAIAHLRTLPCVACLKLFRLAGIEKFVIGYTLQVYLERAGELVASG